MSKCFQICLLTKGRDACKTRVARIYEPQSQVFDPLYFWDSLYLSNNFGVPGFHASDALKVAK